MKFIDVFNLLQVRINYICTSWGTCITIFVSIQVGLNHIYSVYNLAVFNQLFKTNNLMTFYLDRISSTPRGPSAKFMIENSKFEDISCIILCHLLWLSGRAFDKQQTKYILIQITNYVCLEKGTNSSPYSNLG